MVLTEVLKRTTFVPEIIKKSLIKKWHELQKI
jgi:hypothetical protein